MSLYKYPLQLNVLEAAQERIGWTFATFSRICVSFSGGKDSTVMLHLTAQMARAQKRKISVLFIDWEAQFSCTIEHVNALREGYRCHRALLLGGASADHAKFPHSISLNGNAGRRTCAGCASRRKAPSPLRIILIFTRRE
jgi:3'-phosphoadenosine 5'-phosphosulfate sulfotransferase (PAPS reductase)/FAD synthetase